MLVTYKNIGRIWRTVLHVYKENLCQVLLLVMSSEGLQHELGEQQSDVLCLRSVRNVIAALQGGEAQKKF